MFEACLTAGVDAAAKHYQDGCNGGRPSKLTAVDQDLIADMRQRGYTAADVAKQMGVSEPTIKRQEGWKRGVSKPGQNSVSKPYQISKPRRKRKRKRKRRRRRRPGFRLFCAQLPRRLRRTRPPSQRQPRRPNNARIRHCRRKRKGARPSHHVQRTTPVST